MWFAPIGLREVAKFSQVQRRDWTFVDTRAIKSALLESCRDFTKREWPKNPSKDPGPHHLDDSLRRLAAPEEIGRMALFSLQNDYCTGRILEIDGGLRL